MTVALASLAALLAVALAVVASRFVQATRRHDRQLLEASDARQAVQSQLDETRAALDETRAAVEELERRLSAGEGGAETAERLRLQREWAELAGPVADLPVAWDASLASAVGTELEIIREVVGTPGTIEIDGDARPRGGFRLALGAEFLRAAAMDADEMHVHVGDCVVVNGSGGTPAGHTPTPHLDLVKPLMEGAGAELLIERSDGGFTATLRFGD